MPQVIRLKRSGTGSSSPSSLEHGEIAINYADGKLFYKNSSNTITSFAFASYASASHATTHGSNGSDPISIQVSQISDLANGVNAASRMYLWETFR